MDWLIESWDTMNHWGNTTWFEIGTTGVSFYRLLGLVLILVGVWWFSLLIERGISRVAKSGNNTTLSDSAVYALSRIARYAVWIIGTMFGLNYVGLDLANLAFLGGAIGVGIGFGLQAIFSNFISGIIILVERTLKVGDFVDLASGVVGKVTEISIRFTRVTTNDNVDIIVPNSEFINGRVTNWTLNDHLRRIRIPFGVAYGSDKELVREAGIAAALTVDGTINDGKRVPEVWLVNFGESSLDFELVLWVGVELVTSPSRANARYLWALETELGNRGIEIPFPQRDLHVRSGRLQVELSGGLPDGLPQKL
jgi:small-conductance mechanosensitive channel